MKILLSKTKAYSVWIYILSIFVIFLPGCKSKITTEIILEKPSPEQLKDIDKYFVALSQRAKKCGLSISSNSVANDGTIRITCKGGDTQTIKKLFFKKNVEFNFMVLMDESITWQFLHDMDLTNIHFDSSDYFGSRYDSISSYLKLEFDPTQMSPIFAFAYPEDTTYINYTLDSLLAKQLGENYCRFMWGIPVPKDSMRIPLYLLKTDKQNPFEQNESFIDHASVGRNSMTGQIEINISFNTKYKNSWADMTGNHVREMIAIIIENEVYSAPMVNEKIENGRASISGINNEQQAMIISGLLTANQLPFELKVIEAKSN